ncbi:MAG: FHA domain-containing protein [Ilumatobacteraceae bacterium]
MGVVGRQIGKSITRRAAEGAAGSLSGWFEAAQSELPDLTRADLIGFAAHVATLSQPLSKELTVALDSGSHSDSEISSHSYKTTLRSESGLGSDGVTITAFAVDGPGTSFTDWKLLAVPDATGRHVTIDVPAFRTREKKIVNHHLLDAARARLAMMLANGLDVDVVDSLSDIDGLVAPTVLEKGWGTKPAPYEDDHLRDVPEWLIGHPMTMPAGSADTIEQALCSTDTTGVSVQVQRGEAGATLLVIHTPTTASTTGRQRSFRAVVRTLDELVRNVRDQPSVAAAVQHYLDAATAGWTQGTAALRPFWDREVPVPAVRLPLNQRLPVAVAVTGQLRSVPASALLTRAAKRTTIFHRQWTWGMRASTCAANIRRTARRFVLTTPEPGEELSWGRYTQIADSRPQIELWSGHGRPWWWETAVRSRDLGDGRASRTLVLRGISQGASQLLYGTELLTLLRGFVDAARAIDPSAAVQIVRIGGGAPSLRTRTVDATLAPPRLSPLPPPIAPPGSPATGSSWGHPPSEPAAPAAVDATTMPRRVPSAGALRLTFDDGSTVVVDRTTYLGRDPTSNDDHAMHHRVMDDSLSMSKTHARLRCDGAQWWLDDLGSVNGTTVNSMVVASHGTTGSSPLEPPAVVQFGDRTVSVDDA